MMMNFVHVVQHYSIKTVAKTSLVSSIGALSLGNLLNSHLFTTTYGFKRKVSKVIE